MKINIREKCHVINKFDLILVLHNKKNLRYFFLSVLLLILFFFIIMQNQE